MNSQALSVDRYRGEIKIKSFFLGALLFIGYLCTYNKQGRRLGMARPIKETPILFGKDARKFEERMKNPPKETKEQREQRLKDFEVAMKMLKI